MNSILWGYLERSMCPPPCHCRKAFCWQRCWQMPKAMVRQHWIVRKDACNKKMYLPCLMEINSLSTVSILIWEIFVCKYIIYMIYIYIRYIYMSLVAMICPHWNQGSCCKLLAPQVPQAEAGLAALRQVQRFPTPTTRVQSGFPTIVIRGVINPNNG